MSTGNKAIIDRFVAAMDTGATDELARELDRSTTDDFVQEWPQSGERIRGRAAAKRILEGYQAATGTRPRLKMRRIVGGGDLYVIEAAIDYGDGTPVSYVGIAEFRDGSIAKITEYFANPFEAPAWRASIVERMEVEPATV